MTGPVAPTWNAPQNGHEVTYIWKTGWMAYAETVFFRRASVTALSSVQLEGLPAVIGPSSSNTFVQWMRFDTHGYRVRVFN